MKEKGELIFRCTSEDELEQQKFIKRALALKEAFEAGSTSLVDPISGRVVNLEGLLSKTTSIEIIEK